MNRTILLFAVLFLCSCSSDEPAASKTAQEALSKAWQSCLLAAAQRDDDGKSDAATIAIAVKIDCSAKHADWYAATGLVEQANRVRRHDPLLVETIELKEEKFQIEIATSAVLRVRKK